ncbi:MAG: methyltransferase domain-containing protein, partial [Planctomycetes bacterium]|nr:methyltransferase domain-containing protein [Planctomycetota bacterium]
WLAERWSRRYSFEELLRLGFWFNAPTRLALRVNRLRTTPEKFIAALAAAGIGAQTGQRPCSVLLERTSAVEQLPGFAEGWFSVQDESAMSAAERLNPQPGETILDLCAAPGTKTTHIAELMDNRGRIIACDIRSDRLDRVEENARRLQINMIETRVIPGDLSDIPTGPFDAVLVDAPCSNSGVLGKRPEVRWRISLEDVRELAALQSRLLAAAARCVKPNGRIVYSTCSLEPEENVKTVETFLTGQIGWTLLEQTLFIPGQPGDGGFQALLRKS